MRLNYLLRYSSYTKPPGFFLGVLYLPYAQIGHTVCADRTYKSSPIGQTRCDISGKLSIQRVHIEYTRKSPGLFVGDIYLHTLPYRGKMDIDQSVALKKL